MSEIPTERSEHRPEKSEVLLMSAVAEAAHLLRQIAEPRPVGDSIKAAISRAARRVSKHLPQPMHYRRAEDLWRKEARAVRAEEMDAIRRAAKADRLVEEARSELSEIDARIARLEALLVQDEDFHRDQVDAHRAALRRPHRPVDRG